MTQIFNIGDKVTFDSDKVDVFVAETTSVSKEVLQYQKLVLAGINEIGIVKEFGATMTTVTFQDGWELPIPTKYLILLP